MSNFHKWCIWAVIWLVCAVSEISTPDTLNRIAWAVASLFLLKRTFKCFEELDDEKDSKQLESRNDGKKEDDKKA